MQLLNRERLAHTLGAAGLGLGLMASAVGAPAVVVQAHENQSSGIDRQLFHDEEDFLAVSDDELLHLLIQLLQERAQEQKKGGILAFQENDARDAGTLLLEVGYRGDHDALRIEVYNQFTRALADELGIDDPDVIDAAIRNAMMAGVDANDGLSKDSKEELEALIAAAEAPIGPTIRGWGG